MGQVISLEHHRRVRASGAEECASWAATEVAFSFDLGSPSTYLSAERVERLFPGLRWRPALLEASEQVRAGQLANAEARAMALRMPLIWPEPRGATAQRAMRVAAFAADRGRASAFVLAASRLAFCGGFDLDDPEILAEAIAAAALPLDECLRAAADVALDAAMQAEGARLALAGADRLPVLDVRGQIFAGEERLAEAAAAVCAPDPTPTPTLRFRRRGGAAG
jgi:2-hydroxychromene-2-carboxylate isomerase